MNYGKREITLEYIQSKTSELDLYRYYCKNFKNVRETFCSDLREDNIPSCSIQSWNNTLFYKDFSTGDSYNVYGYLMRKYNLSFKEVLNMIAKDFQLVKDDYSDFPTMLYFGIPEKKKVESKESVIIKVKIRNWNNQDKLFWKDRYNISSKELNKYKIFPLSGFWLNDYYNICNDICYGYYFGKLEDKEMWKIYQPFKDKKFKWLNNVHKSVLQGDNQLKQIGVDLYITSSLKDVIVLDKLGYNAIAPSSETAIIDENKIIDYKNRFNNLILFYDNDEPGIIASNKHKKLYNCNEFMIPIEYNVKDPSDFVEVYGYDKLKEIIDEDRKNICNR